MDEDDCYSTSEAAEQIPPTPSCCNGSDDSRIKCTNQGAINDIIKLTLSQIPELADSSIEDPEDFISQFSKSFKAALLENIVVNDLPLMLDSSRLTTSQTEDKNIVIDNALCAKLCHTIAKTTQKRKQYPKRCSQIMKQKMKHEFLNVKKGEVFDSSEPKDYSEAFKIANHTKSFDEFCKEFNSIQEQARCRTLKRKELDMKISLAKDMQRSQQGPSRPRNLQM